VKEELDTLRIVVEKLRTFQKITLAYLRKNDNKEAIFLELKEELDLLPIEVEELRVDKKNKHENDKEEALFLALKEEIDGF
jgi:hypothetical protein